MEASKRLKVAFIWHMHQPYYKDPVCGKYLMPWVRLHGVKDYYPMAAMLEEFDSVKVTFNMVPVLVEQIKDYASNGATDTLLDLTVKKAADLSGAEKVEILENFFKVNFKRFIEPNPRYSELLIKKGLKEVSGARLKKTVESFTKKDFLDLQVLFNLAWFHSMTIDRDANLKEIAARGKAFTEEDKEYVVSKQREILGSILPLYRKLLKAGRIEITATPYYHPILPLLCDTSVARVSMPSARLPRKRFAHPEDASWQVAEAIRYHTEQFGTPARGMWPSEGSISEEALEILISKGIDWIAADEDILFKSLSAYDRKYKTASLFDRRMIYKPYSFKKDSRHINIVFRDKNLSDLVSFNYNSWEPVAAAEDLLGHFRRVAENLRRNDDTGLLTIVMDGENAWEYYEDNARAFFEHLYFNLDRDEMLASTTVSDYLAVEPPRKTLSGIFPGSWINHNFDIWIGQEQDNLSWEYLSRTRRDLVKFTKLLHKKESGGADIQKAWRELYIAEGSDWNWWYAGKVGTNPGNPFDRLYRMHLGNVYRYLEKKVPDFLKISIA